jgi:protein phosphatase
MKIKAGALTDIGLNPKRKINEDSYYVYDKDTSNPKTVERGYIYCVADGVGGLAAGEVASKMAIETLVKAYYEDEWLKSPKLQLKKAIESANDKVFKESKSNAEYNGMASTITAVVLLNSLLTVGQVGDSRCYLFRKNRLTRLTKDQVNPAIAHQILQAIGIDASINPVIDEFKIFEGDRLLLCSDGLHGVLKDRVIEETMKKRRNSTSLLTDLIAKVKQQGAPDNVTVVSVCIEPDRESILQLKPMHYILITQMIIIIVLLISSINLLNYKSLHPETKKQDPDTSTITKSNKETDIKTIYILTTNYIDTITVGNTIYCYRTNLSMKDMSYFKDLYDDKSFNNKNNRNNFSLEVNIYYNAEENNKDNIDLLFKEIGKKFKLGFKYDKTELEKKDPTFIKLKIK